MVTGAPRAPHRRSKVSRVTPRTVKIHPPKDLEALEGAGGLPRGLWGTSQRQIHEKGIEIDLEKPVCQKIYSNWFLTVGLEQKYC